MFEWNDSQLMIRDTVRRFVEEEIVPNVQELEHGDMPPYDILRKMYAAFGMGRDGARSLREAGRSGKARREAQGSVRTERPLRAGRSSGCDPDSDH